MVFPALAALYVGLASRPQFLTGDPAYYLTLAEALVSGRGYVFDGVAHTHYPPGLPFLLTPTVALFGRSVAAAQIWVALMGVLGLVAVAAWLRSRGDVPRPLLLAALVGVSTGYVALATRGIRSEMPYVALSFGMLAVVERARDGRPIGRRWILVAALAGLTVLTRTVGVALAGSLVLAALHVAARRGGRRAGYRVAPLLVGACVGLLAFAAWSAWVAANPDGPSYFEAFLLRDPHEPDLGPAAAADILARLLGTIRIQVAHAAELLTGVDWLLPLAGSPLLFGAALTVGTGTALELRRPNPLAAWYLLAFFGVLSLWPYDEGKRFLVPVLPLLLLFGWKGAARLLQLCRSSGRRRCGAWALAAAGVGLVVLALEVRALDAFSRQAAAASGVWVVVLVGAGLAVRGSGRAVWRPKGVWLAGIWLAFYLPANAVGSVAAAGDAVGGREAGIRTLVEWVGRETDPDAVVMTREEAAVVLYADRSVARLPVTADPGRLLKALDRADPDYLMVTEPHDHAYYRPTPPQVLATLDSVLPAGRLRTVIETDGGRIVVIGRADGPREPRGTGGDAPEVPPSAR